MEHERGREGGNLRWESHERVARSTTPRAARPRATWPSSRSGRERTTRGRAACPRACRRCMICTRRRVDARTSRNRRRRRSTRTPGSRGRGSRSRCSRSDCCASARSSTRRRRRSATRRRRTARPAWLRCELADHQLAAARRVEGCHPVGRERFSAREANPDKVSLFINTFACDNNTSDHIIRRAPLPVSSAKLSRIELG